MTLEAVARPEGKTSLTADVERLLAGLSFAEKAALLAGSDTWHFGGVPRLGLAPLRVADCGHGITLVDEGVRGTTCLPTAIAMGATWDPALIERAGALLGRECRAMGIGILLGPMVNLQRLPVGGRNFEAFSEDTLLTGVLGAALIRGIQGTGTGACAKHVAGYAQTKFSRTHSAEIDPRTLHELYLRHFAYIARHARPAAMMTSYNRVNGEHTAAHRGLIEGFLRGTLGFEGLVLSDWGGVHDVDSIAAGLDLEMPGPPRQVTAEALSGLMEAGRLTVDQLDAHAGRVLSANLTHAIDRGQPAALDTSAHRALAREVAEAAITLLKNDGDLLPLDPARLKRIAVIGPNAATARLGASGSASVTPAYSVSPLEGLRARLGETVEIAYVEGCPAHGEGLPVRGLFNHVTTGGTVAPGLAVEFFNNLRLEGAPAHAGVAEAIDFTWGWAAPAPGVRRGQFGVRFEGALVPDRSGPVELHLLYESGGARLWCDGRLVHDNWEPDSDGHFEARYGAFEARIPLSLEPGRPVAVRLDFRQLASGSALRLEWPADPVNPLVAAAVAAARSADAVIVCAGLCNRFEGGGTDRPTLSLPPGQDDLIAAVAAANPRTVVVLNGATAMAMPWLAQVGAVLHAFYPGQEGGAALARILCGDRAPSGRLPVTLPRRLEDVRGMAFYPGTAEQVVFGEGVFVGYRHFVTAGVEPLFPFGFGLTYTRFTYGNLRLSTPRLEAGETLEVSIDLTNTGGRAGAEVVQLYLGAKAPSLPRPTRELRAFAKVGLAAGERRRVTFTLGAADLAYYCEARGAWRAERGTYAVRVGPDCAAGLDGEFVFGADQTLNLLEVVAVAR